MGDNGQQESPEFDFSNVSRKWQRDFARSLSKATRAQLTLQRVPSADATDEEIDALLDRQEQALDDFETMADEQAGLIAQVLVDVPRSWCIEGAPEKLDWSDVASLDWVQADKYNEILTMVRERNVAKDDAKNSDGRSRSQRKRPGR